MDNSHEVERGVVSRRRVADHGEVLTGKREVDAMLALVAQEVERIDSRFLEPACGTGNFLAEILTRKLFVVRGRYATNQRDYELHAIEAIGSLYGIDILLDNILSCRQRLLEILCSEHVATFQCAPRRELSAAARYVVHRNIIWGDALRCMTLGAAAEPIVFSEWSCGDGDSIKRRDYSFKSLIDQGGTENKVVRADRGDNRENPQPLKEHESVSISQLGEGT